MDSDAKLWTYHQLENIPLLARSHPRQNMILRLMRRLVKNGTVLEIGFGDGYLLKRLAKHYQALAADISQENIDLVKKQVPEAEYALVDTDGTLPYQDHSVDGFIASEVFEHMSDEEVKVSVDEMHRILKKGGYAILTFPAYEDLQKNDCYCPNCGHNFHRWGHKQYWDHEKVRQTFGRKLEVVQLSTFFVRHIGKSKLETILAYQVHLARTAINKMVRIEGSSFLVVLRNK